MADNDFADISDLLDREIEEYMKQHVDEPIVEYEESIKEETDEPTDQQGTDTSDSADNMYETDAWKNLEAHRQERNQWLMALQEDIEKEVPQLLQIGTDQEAETNEASGNETGGKNDDMEEGNLDADDQPVPGDLSQPELAVSEEWLTAEVTTNDNVTLEHITENVDLRIDLKLIEEEHAQSLKSLEAARKEAMQPVYDSVMETEVTAPASLEHSGHAEPTPTASISKKEQPSKDTLSRRKGFLSGFFASMESWRLSRKLQSLRSEYDGIQRLVDNQCIMRDQVQQEISMFQNRTKELQKSIDMLKEDCARTNLDQLFKDMIQESKETLQCALVRQRKLLDRAEAFKNEKLEIDAASLRQRVSEVKTAQERIRNENNDVKGQRNQFEEESKMLQMDIGSLHTEWKGEQERSEFLQKELLLAKEEKYKRLLNRSTRCIQQYWRCKKSYRRFRTLRRVVVLLQYLWRKYLKRKRVQQEVAAIRIQAIYRGYRCRMLFEQAKGARLMDDDDLAEFDVDAVLSSLKEVTFDQSMDSYLMEDIVLHKLPRPKPRPMSRGQNCSDMHLESIKTTPTQSRPQSGCPVTRATLPPIGSLKNAAPAPPTKRSVAMKQAAHEWGIQSLKTAELMMRSKQRRENFEQRPKIREVHQDPMERLKQFQKTNHFSTRLSAVEYEWAEGQGRRRSTRPEISSRTMGVGVCSPLSDYGDRNNSTPISRSSSIVLPPIPLDRSPSVTSTQASDYHEASKERRGTRNPVTLLVNQNILQDLNKDVGAFLFPPLH